jgi:hypothetical protein
MQRILEEKDKPPPIYKQFRRGIQTRLLYGTIDGPRDLLLALSTTVGAARFATLNIEHRTSNVQRPTSKGREGRRSGSGLTR